MLLYEAWKRGLPRKFARFVPFCLIKKYSFNLLCVLNLFFFFSQNAGSELCFRFVFPVNSVCRTNFVPRNMANNSPHWPCNFSRVDLYPRQKEMLALQYIRRDMCIVALPILTVEEWKTPCPSSDERKRRPQWLQQGSHVLQSSNVSRLTALELQFHKYLWHLYRHTYSCVERENST